MLVLRSGAFRGCCHRSIPLTLLSRDYSCSRLRYSSAGDPKSENEASVETTLTPNGEKMLYQGEATSQFIVRAMFGVGTLNTFYWGSQLINNWWFKGVEVHGIALAGDPWWGYTGGVCTVFIVFFAREFAHRCRSYYKH